MSPALIYKLLERERERDGIYFWWVVLKAKMLEMTSQKGKDGGGGGSMKVMENV